MDALEIVQYLAAGSIGAAVGAGELISRYKDDPKRLLTSPSAWFYLLVNAIAAGVVLYFIHAIPIQVSNTATWAFEVMAAGFGAMAILRTSVFTPRINNTDIAVGPQAFLQVVLVTADRAVDRSQAQPRAQAVKTIMAGVSFAKAQVALPTHCFALMQNVSADEQEAVAKEIAKLETATMDDQVKAQSLGLILLNIVGESVLRAAVDALGASIKP